MDCNCTRAFHVHLEKDPALKILPVLTFGSLLFLIACSEQNEPLKMPGPVAMTEEAVGHYCQMSILEHTGPKAQIHLKNIAFPIWFSQVRDAVAFTRLPEETQEPVAIYVNDMGKAEDWDFPTDDTWIDIQTAFFVINSDKIGGMGAPETIPFGSQETAIQFSAIHGGQVVRFNEIPDDYVLGPVDINPQKHTITGAVK